MPSRGATVCVCVIPAAPVMASRTVTQSPASSRKRSTKPRTEPGTHEESSSRRVATWTACYEGTRMEQTERWSRPA
uniref:Putative secreted protein n=1 Tax=Anopheles darlingi TaxID=43151 RepID=A0A2M4D4F3_ANODA